MTNTLWRTLGEGLVSGREEKLGEMLLSHTRGDSGKEVLNSEGRRKFGKHKHSDGT